MSKTRFLVVAFIIVAAFGPLPATAADKLVTVNGEGMISVAPDAAVIGIGVTSQGKTAREASAANAKQMTAVLAAIKGTGIADGDVQTTQLSLQPQYETDKGNTARLTGFRATNQLNVRIHDINKLPDLLDHAIGAGANQMSGIEFLVSDRSKVLDQARTAAIEDAHRKAELYAKAAGAKVGPVVAISEAGASPPPRPFQAMLRAGAKAAIPIAPGEHMLHVSVTVSYELTQ